MEILKYLLMNKKNCFFCQAERKIKYHLCQTCIERMDFVNGTRYVEDIPIYFPLLYLGVTKSMVDRYKFSERTYLKEVLGEIVLDFFAQKELTGTLVTIPSTQKKKNRRGFDPLEKLALYLKEKGGYEVYSDALIKIRDTKDQHELSQEQRKTNLQNAFRLNRSLIGKDILLFDDIVTSKNTLKETIQTIKNTQVRSITCVTICSTVIRDM